MQCPIPVQGRECGANAQTQSAWIAQRDDARVLHFDCTQGHRFHIGPCERWQTCRCHGQEKTTKTTMSAGHLHTVNNEVETVLRTLAAQKGIQVIVSKRKFKS